MVNTAVQSRVLQLSGELKSQGVRGVPELFKVAQSIERHHQDSRVKVMVTRPAFANIFLQHMPFLTIEFPASEKLLFIPSFAEAWELRKPTPDYTAFMQKLTRNYSSFVGTESDLEKLLTSLAVCYAEFPPLNFEKINAISGVLSISEPVGWVDPPLWRFFRLRQKKQVSLGSLIFPLLQSRGFLRLLNLCGPY